jgi:hypothetical protein
VKFVRCGWSGARAQKKRFFFLNYYYFSKENFFIRKNENAYLFCWKEKLDSLLVQLVSINL